MLRFAHRLAAFMAIVLYCVIWYQATIKVGAGSGQPTEVPRPRRSSIWIGRGQQDVQASQEVGQEGLPHPQRAQRRQRQEQHASPTAPCVLYAGVLFRAGVCSVFHHMRTADALDGCVSICRRQRKHGAVVCSVMLSMIAFDSLCGVRTTWLRSQQTATYWAGTASAFRVLVYGGAMQTWQRNPAATSVRVAGAGRWASSSLCVQPLWCYSFFRSCGRPFCVLRVFGQGVESTYCVGPVDGPGAYHDA